MKVRNREYKNITTKEEFAEFYKKISSDWSSGLVDIIRFIDNETFQPSIAAYNTKTKEAWAYSLNLAQDAKNTGLLE